MPEKFPTDPTLIAELRAFIAENKLTYKALCKMLLIENVTETFLSKYLSDKLDRQVDNFESRCRDMLKGLRERIAYGNQIFESSVTSRIGNAFDLIRCTGQIGFITGKAGHGKTSGIHRFIHRTPTALSIPLHANGGSASKLESAIFSRIDTKSWNGRTSRFDYLAERFKESSRMIILDNSQRLDSTGRNWLFDFHDATNNPIGCVGNPEALKPILANDQHSRRLGICTSYELSEDETPDMARKVASQFSDLETADAIADLVAVIASNDGALGSVSLTVVLMQELRKASAKLRDDPRTALRAAHARLSRNYTLPND